jgi:hypothetical protein
MGTIQVPDSFKRSYEAFETYPNNLVHQAAYPPALKAYTERLNNSSGILFVQNDTEGDVSFRDLEINGQGTTMLREAETYC